MRRGKTQKPIRVYPYFKHSKTKSGNPQLLNGPHSWDKVRNKKPNVILGWRYNELFRGNELSNERCFFVMIMAQG
jgi:hypothetical protein